MKPSTPALSIASRRAWKTLEKLARVNGRLRLVMKTWRSPVEGLRQSLMYAMTVTA